MKTINETINEKIIKPIQEYTAQELNDVAYDVSLPDNVKLSEVCKWLVKHGLKDRALLGIVYCTFLSKEEATLFSLTFGTSMTKR